MLKKVIYTVLFWFSINGYSNDSIELNNFEDHLNIIVIGSSDYSQDNNQMSDNEKFKKNEEDIIDPLLKGLYSKALEKSQELENKAIKINAEYWICVSYYYTGFIARCTNDYDTALKYFFQIVNHKNKPFENDYERMIKVYGNIADIYKRSNKTEDAINYFKLSLKLKDKVKNKKTLISTYVNLGSIYSSQSKYVEAREYYLGGLELSSEEPDNITAIIFNNLGNDEYSQENYSKASEYYLKSIQISEKIEDFNGLALSYNNMGNIYYNSLKNFDKAILYYNKSLEIEKKRNNPEGIASELINLGTVLSATKKFDEAQKVISDALQIFKTNKNINGIAKALEDLGALYTLSGDFKKAIQTLSECINICENNNIQINFPNIYNNVGALYYYNKGYNKALHFYFKGLELAQKTDDKEIIKRIYSGIKDAYAKLGNFDKAYYYLGQYSILKDTLLNATISKQIIEMQEKYEKSKMEQKVAMQNLEIKTKSLQRNGVTIILILSILVFSSVIYFILQKRKNEKLLYIKNTTIKDQEIQNLVQQSEIKSMLSMADGQESERQRISRELHDRVGSMLSLIKLNLSHYKPEDYPFIQENIELLNNTYQEVRNISHNLHSGILNQFGLKVALNDLKKTIESSHALLVDLNFHDNNIIIPRETEVTIFRILQELITNVLKHASAKNIDIQINNNDKNTCLITVEDDGIGFDVKNKEGIGLKNINYRLTSIGGSLEINSQKGKGTFILLEIPIFNEDKVPTT